MHFLIDMKMKMHKKLIYVENAIKQARRRNDKYLYWEQQKSDNCLGQFLKSIHKNNNVKVEVDVAKLANLLSDNCLFC